jgi:hypothetical protein
VGFDVMVENRERDRPWVVQSLVQAKVDRMGRAIALGEPAAAPFSLRDCLAYDAWVDEPGLFGPVILAREQRVTAFALDDGTIVEHVERIRARLEDCFDSGHLREPGEALRYFLARHGRAHVDFLGLNRTLRYREAIVLPGDLVHVHGHPLWRPSAQGVTTGGYRDAPAQLVMHNCTLELK